MVNTNISYFESAPGGVRKIAIGRKTVQLKRPKSYSFNKKKKIAKVSAYGKVKKYFDKNFPDKKVLKASKQGRKNLYVGEIRFFKGIAREEAGLFFGKRGLLSKKARNRGYYD